MKSRNYRRLSWAALASVFALFVLSGCGTVQTVLGHCELPENLNKPLDYLTDLPTDKPMPRSESDPRWAEDRSHDAMAVTHNNETLKYVEDHCQ